MCADREHLELMHRDPAGTACWRDCDVSKVIEGALLKVVLPGRPLAVALGLSTAFAIGIVGHARAQDTESQVGQASRPSSFNIPAQPLASALTAFGRQAGLQVIVDPAVVEGRSSAGVSGTLTAEEALGRILAGTGISYRFTSANSVTIAAAGQSGLPPGVMQLDPVQVRGMFPVPPQAMIDNLPPAYAGGQVATGGQVGMLGNRSVMNNPFSQTSYTKKLIEDQQARTLVDVLANESSVITGVKGGGRNDFWVFRGFPVQTYGASNSLNGLAGMAPLQFASTDFIERVEVLRGPNALLMGTAMTGHGALGGTVNLVTKRAGDEPLTQWTTRYMSNSQFGAHADVGRRFGANKEFGIRFNGSLDGGNTPVDTQQSTFGTAAINLDFRGERVRVSADFEHQWSRLSSPTSTLTINGVSGVLRSLSTVPAAPSNSTPFSPSWAEGTQKITLGMIQGEVDILENVTAYAAIGKQRYEATATDDDLLLLNGSGAVGIRSAAFRDRTDVLSMQGGINARISTGSIGHALSLNLSRIERTYDSTPLSRAGAGIGAIIPVGSLYNPAFPTTPVFPPYQAIVPANKTTASSVAIADTISFLDGRIQFTAGVRYNEIQSQSFQFSSVSTQSPTYRSSAWSPAFALVVKPWENVSLYANYIQALEMGSIVSSSFANAGEVFPPYTSKQYETGIKVDWGSVTTTLALFQITQPQTTSFPDPAAGLPRLTLDGEQRNRGIELAAYGAPFEGVRLLSGVTLMEATQLKTDNGRDGWPAALAPKFRAVIGGEWDTPFMKGLTLTGRLTRTSDVMVLNSRPDLTVPAWTQVDLGARYTFSSPANDKPISLIFNVDNLFNESYWKVTHPTAGNLLRSDARTFRLSAVVDF
jgi:iron complex outermembrane receptor protein